MSDQKLQDSRSALIDAIMIEMERVWGPDGFGGEYPQYDWLLKHYDITEDEDVEWQGILEDYIDDVPEEDRGNEELMSFLRDDVAVTAFLTKLLMKYRKGTATYPSA